MLVQFSVKNFRSISEKQTLSMVTESADGKDEDVLSTGFNAVPKVRKTAAILGGNGSGKSNLLKAMIFAKDFVRTSFKDTQSGQRIKYSPFLFSKNAHKQPSEFEFVFVHKGYLFQYGFSLDSVRVHDEWLFATPLSSKKQKAQTWFVRNKEAPDKSYVDKNIPGKKELWKESTRSNSLFLSTAAHNNSKYFEIPLEWISYYLRVILNPENMQGDFSTKKIKDDKYKAKLIEFMRQFDDQCSNFTIEESKLNDTELDEMKEFLSPNLIDNMKNKNFEKVYASHTLIDGSTYSLPLDEESQGTVRLFAFAGPILDTLQNGFTLVVDELHNSLHPLAMKKIVKTYKSNKLNKNKAQFIFTTHETNIMDDMNKDQLWLVEKNRMGETNIKSIDEFKTERTGSYSGRYLSGRYGAVPNIGEDL